MSPTVYKRILLKLSGEVVAGAVGYGIDGTNVRSILLERFRLCGALEVQVAIVLGGGNIFRGIAGERVGLNGLRRLHGHVGDGH